MLAAPCCVGTRRLHICCTQWILAAPGTLGRKASPTWALGASGCRFGAGLLRTLWMNGRGMAKLPGMMQRRRGFGKRCSSPADGDLPGTEHAGAPSAALVEARGTRVPSSRPAAGEHGLLQTLPFPGLGSKEQSGFHFSRADRPLFFAD